MPSRSTASDYSPDDLLLVRQTCLYLFSDLPPGLTDSITVVGGLVPSLLIPQPAAQERRHLGTADLDVGLALALLTETAAIGHCPVSRAIQQEFRFVVVRLEFSTMKRAACHYCFFDTP